MSTCGSDIIANFSCATCICGDAICVDCAVKIGGASAVGDDVAKWGSAANCLTEVYVACSWIEGEVLGVRSCTINYVIEADVTVCCCQISIII